MCGLGAEEGRPAEFISVSGFPKRYNITSVYPKRARALTATNYRVYIGIMHTGIILYSCSGIKAEIRFLTTTTIVFPFYFIYFLSFTIIVHENCRDFFPTNYLPCNSYYIYI